jgi:hypothetical protein
MIHPFHSTIREDIRFLGKLLGDTLRNKKVLRPISLSKKFVSSALPIGIETISERGWS